MNIVAINKISDKLKIWSVEMPNATYSNRFMQVGARAILSSDKIK